MKLSKSFVIGFACLFLHAFWAVPAQSEIVDRTVATVNGEIILYSDLQTQIAAIQKMNPEIRTDDPLRKAQVEREILNQMIRQRLADDEIKRQKISVSSSELDSAAESVWTRNNLTRSQFERYLQQNGKDMETFRTELKKEIERNKLVERVFRMKTVITEKQVDEVMRTGKGESIVTGKRLHLGIIFLPGNDKKTSDESEKLGKDLVSRIRGGEDFGKMAVQYSKGPAVSDGGDVGYLGADEIAPHIAKAMEGLQKGQISDLVKGQGGYYIVKLYDVDVQTQSKSSPDMRERIKTELMQKEIDRKFEEWVKGLEEKAFIEITL